MGYHVCRKCRHFRHIKSPIKSKYGRAALRMYHAHFPDRGMPVHTIFQRLHRQLREPSVWESLATLVLTSEGAFRVRETPGIFERVRQLFHRRCQACIVTSRRNFEQLL
ncbi:hypothetical protein TNCV_4041791 [Trichonephila clavipes]|nr:hypothetical protein TNCV_4041791 [Trichonephila clavipes]